ncbi:septal ring lytic transglycosylase RlpA family protein [Rhizobium halophilum]|uniref:septal ring lytic transglycosylase RlpA family protein n=1 Tax=Rhizobium halophilum TaxID=2846852 RepID=UPI00374D04D6
MKLNGGMVSHGAKWLTIAMVCLSAASCATTEPPKKKARSKEYFSEKEYGVKASPRVVAEGRPVPKGGGRFVIGKPYEVKGKTYVPKEDPSYNKSGLASWYGSAFHGRLTANGEVYDKNHLSAAHPTFPLPSYARVTNLDTGSSVIVRVNDRGPYHPGRIIDVSSKTADLLDMKRTGTAKVNVEYVGRARMDGHDMPYLMASYSPKGDRFPAVLPEGQVASGVMVASAEPFDGRFSSNPAPTPRATPAVPTSMAWSGSTPTDSAPSAAVGAIGDLASAGEFSYLPEIGPIPTQRPGYGFAAARGDLSSAYNAEPIQTVELVFDAVMVRNDGLTEQSILSYMQRSSIKN